MFCMAISGLHDSLIKQILSYLPWTDLTSSGAVCKSWKKSALELIKHNYYPNIFRPKDWEDFWGCRTLDTALNFNEKKMKGGYKGLPNNFFEILNLPCPFEPEVKIKDTYSLVFIPFGLSYKGAHLVNQPPPQTLNVPLNLSHFKDMTSTHTEHHKTKHYRLRTLGAEQNSMNVGENSHWVLMKRRHIDHENRSDLAFFQQQEIDLQSKGCAIPCPLQAAICISAIVFSGLEHTFVGSNHANSIICKSNKKTESLKVTTIGPCNLNKDSNGSIYELFADPIFLSFPGRLVPFIDLSNEATLKFLNDKIKTN